MNQINGRAIKNQYDLFYFSQPRNTAKTDEAGSRQLTNSIGLPPYTEDQISISQTGYEKLEDASLRQEADPIDELLRSLQDQYKELFCQVQGSMSKDQILHFAASHQKGTYILISDSFLEKMGKDEASFEKYSKFLISLFETLSKGEKQGKGVYLDDKGAAFWDTVTEQSPLDQLKSELENQKKMFQKMYETLSNTKKSTNDRKIKVSANSYYTGGSYAKLAKATSKGQVQAVISQAHRNIASLRSAAVFGDEKERKKAETAISSYQKLLLRSRQKVKRLDEEQLIRVRQKKAEKQELERKAKRIRLELEKKKTKRKSADYATICEGQSEENKIRRLEYLERTADQGSNDLSAVGETSMPSFASLPVGDTVSTIQAEVITSYVSFS